MLWRTLCYSLSARWGEACVGCPQKPPATAAALLMVKCAAAEAHVTVASVSAKPRIQESFMGLAANAMTGSVPSIMGKPAMTEATATVGRVSVTKAGSVRPASSRKTAPSQARKAKSSAKTLKESSAPTEALVTVAAAYVTTRTTGA